MLFVQHNLLAENANRQLNVSTKKNAKTTEKLSSGYKINRAADDAAGLSISEKMRRQVRGLHQTVSNISEGTGYVQTAEGALNEVHDMLQRMNELAVKSANGTNTEEDRAYIDREVQQLKAEMDRIFETTTFNEQRIWEPRERKLIGTVPKQAVEFTYAYESIAVTNDNCGVVAYGDYTINASEKDGIYINWTGYDGKPYKTTPITWEELKEKNFSFDMADYFGEKTADNKLYDAKGNPVFRHQVAFAPETSDIKVLVECIDQKTFSSSAYADMEGRFEDNKGNEVKSNVSTPLVNLNYQAAYASNHNTGKDSSTSTNIHDFDKADDAFLEPANNNGTLVQTLPSGGNLTNVPANGTNSVDVAKESSDKWEFTFKMDGIGTVKGTSYAIHYSAPSDLDADDYPYWWHWVSATIDGVYYPHYSKSPNSIPCNEKGGGTLGSLMQTLTGAKGTSTPGLLSPPKGAADNGGYIRISFDLESQEKFKFGDGKESNDVGSFVLQVPVYSSDTEQSVLNRVNGALNSNTILDFYTPAGQTTRYGSAHFGTATAGRKTIDVPVYGGTCGFYVQGGTESGEHIQIQYEALSTIALGIDKTNTLTVDSSGDAINEIKAALQTVSEQRSTFGAYQNRLEHAENINANVEENTQAAESLIRDADIADLMMEYSVNNILMQAGTSMLTQANQANQRAVELLG